MSTLVGTSNHHTTALINSSVEAVKQQFVELPMKLFDLNHDYLTCDYPTALQMRASAFFDHKYYFSSRESTRIE
jgi:hypothetical protein